VRLLECFDDEKRRVRVVELSHDGSRLYYDGGVLYTAIDAAGRNKLDYVHAMVARLPRQGRILMLGAAGGALASELSRSGAEVTAVDVWAGAFNIARRWFHLPKEVTCVHADAVTFLHDTTIQWSAIAIDVYDGVSIPPSMFAAELADRLKSVLAPGGQVVWNVAAGLNELDTRRIVQLLERTGLQTSAHPVHRDETLANTLVVGRRTDARAQQ
jgi:spermidine synthase